MIAYIVMDGIDQRQNFLYQNIALLDALVMDSCY
jgi:hypothetical protein